MKRLASRLRRLPYDSRGATVVEFGLVIIPLSIVALVGIDFGYRAYLQSMVDGTLFRAARMATVGSITGSTIDTYVIAQITSLSKSITSSNVAITKKSYHDFSSVAQAEKITQDTYPFGVYNVGDCYEDSNNNGIYDSMETSGTGGLGGSDDIVYYTVTVTFPRIVPLSGFLGWSSTETVTSMTTLRNQPFGAQTTPPIKCN